MAYETSESEAEESNNRLKAKEFNGEDSAQTLEPVQSDRGLALKDAISGWRGLLIGLGLGAAIALTVSRLLPAPQNSPATQTNQAPGQSVTVAPVEVTGISRTLEATGSVAALDLLPVLPQATGLQIQKVLVEEGDTVAAGQVLAALDSSVLQSQLDQATAQLRSAQAVVRQKQAQLQQQRATLAEAESNLRRYEALAREGAITRQELESRRTTVATARESVSVAQADIASAQADVQGLLAQIQRAQTQIEQTLVRAPDRGIIAEKIARIGDVTGSNKLFSIIRNGSLELQAKVPETQLAQVKVGAPAQIISSSDRRINLQGRVREIAPLVDAQTRQATVKINLPASPLLRPGMFLKAAITVQLMRGMTVPAQAVLPQSGERSQVYVLEGADTVQARTVEVGTRQDSPDPTKARVEIKSGLQPGDRVVVDGAGYVKDGDRVTVVQ